MKQAENEPVNTSSPPQYKIPFSITACYILGIIGVFLGAVLVITGFTGKIEQAYIGGGFIGGSIMLFTIYYIASDLHYLSWASDIRARRDRDYQSFMLRHLQRIEESLNSERKPNKKESSDQSVYMDL